MDTGFGLAEIKIQGLPFPHEGFIPKNPKPLNTFQKLILKIKQWNHDRLFRKYQL